MKISVFGATGFIGSRFCEMYPDDVIFRERGKQQSASDDILYLISTTHNYNKIYDDVYTNLWFLSGVLSHLTPSNTFNYISSWFIYRGAPLPAQEHWGGMCDPLGNYSLTKWLAERLVIQYCEREDISYRIFRLANVFGKGDKFSKQKNALQYLINEMKHDRDIYLYNNGRFYRDYIHVDDVCWMLKFGMDVLPVNDIYNIGSGRKILFLDLITLAHTILNSKSKIYEKEPADFHKQVQVKDFWMDVTKVESFEVRCQNSPYEQLVRMILDE